MARSPDGQSERPHQSPSPGRGATGGRNIVLTASAERYALQEVIADALLSLELGPDCAVGDIVTLLEGATTHDFSILRRRWVFVQKAATLEITLDRPAR